LSKRNIIIQKLIAIARADTCVEEIEKTTLRKISEKLDINPTFVDQMLGLME